MLGICLALAIGSSAVIVNRHDAAPILVKVDANAASSAHPMTHKPAQPSTARALQPTPALAARLAKAHLVLNPLTKAQLARVRRAQTGTNGFTATKAMRAAERGSLDATSFTVYIGSFTDYELLRATPPSESGPPVIANLPAYLVLIQGATTSLNGGPCMVPCPDRPTSFKTDMVVVYSAIGGALEIESTL
jgi:hypothetical protein